MLSILRFDTASSNRRYAGDRYVIAIPGGSWRNFLPTLIVLIRIHRNFPDELLTPHVGIKRRSHNCFLAKRRREYRRTVRMPAATRLECLLRNARTNTRYICPRQYICTRDSKRRRNSRASGFFPSINLIAVGRDCVQLWSASYNRVFLRGKSLSGYCFTRAQKCPRHGMRRCISAAYAFIHVHTHTHTHRVSARYWENDLRLLCVASPDSRFPVTREPRKRSQLSGASREIDCHESRLLGELTHSSRITIRHRGSNDA